MGIANIDPAAVSARLWGTSARVPTTLGTPAGVYCFGATELATLRNRAPGFDLNRLIGSASAYSGGYARLQPLSYQFDTGILETASVAIIMTARMPNAPPGATTAVVDLPGFAGNYTAATPTGIRLCYSSYATTPSVTLLSAASFDVSGTPTLVNTQIAGVTNPTAWKIIGVSYRDGVDRAIYNLTDATQTVTAETRARRIAARTIKLGLNIEAQASGVTDICNCIILTGGLTLALMQTARDWLRNDAASQGITA